MSHIKRQSRRHDTDAVCNDAAGEQRKREALLSQLNILAARVSVGGPICPGCGRQDANPDLLKGAKLPLPGSRRSRRSG